MADNELMPATLGALRMSNPTFEFGNSNRVRIWLRIALLFIGLILFSQAIWIAGPELFHTSVIGLALDDKARPSTRLEQERAQQAASLAGVRGDLWSESAFAYSSQLWNAKPALSTDTAIAVRKDLENAVRYSPHRGDAWLMFAGMAARYKWRDYKRSSLLKMSYYTAPKEVRLIPLRLLISLREWTDDPELRELISGEIRLVLTRLPNLRSSLSRAYDAASAEGKIAVEQAVSKIDASQLKLITGKTP